MRRRHLLANIGRHVNVKGLPAPLSPIPNTHHAQAPSSSSPRTRLSKALIVTARRWSRTIAPAEAERLAPIVESLSQRYLGPDYSDPEKRGVLGQITAADIPRLDQESFPLCMHSMFQVGWKGRRGGHAWGSRSWCSDTTMSCNNGPEPLTQYIPSAGAALESPPQTRWAHAVWSLPQGAVTSGRSEKRALVVHLCCPSSHSKYIAFRHRRELAFLWRRPSDSGGRRWRRWRPAKSLTRNFCTMSGTTTARRGTAATTRPIPAPRSSPRPPARCGGSGGGGRELGGRWPQIGRAFRMGTS